MSNLPQETRVVKVISTMTLQPKLFNLPNGATWGDVLSVMPSSDIPPQYRAVVRETKQDLVENDARLPDGDTTIWMTPTAVKSGEGASPSPTYREIRPLVADFAESINDAVSEFLSCIATIIENETEPGISFSYDEDDERWMELMRNDPNGVYESMGLLAYGLLQMAFNIMFTAADIKEGCSVYSFLDDLDNPTEFMFSNEHVRKSLAGRIKTMHQARGTDLPDSASSEVAEMLHFFNEAASSS